MAQIIRVHRLATLLENPDDVRTETLRAIIRAGADRVIVQDAQTGETFIPTLTGRSIALAPCAAA